jgi:hypothetical protein
VPEHPTTVEVAAPFAPIQLAGEISAVVTTGGFTHVPHKNKSSKNTVPP